MRCRGTCPPSRRPRAARETRRRKRDKCQRRMLAHRVFCVRVGREEIVVVGKSSTMGRSSFPIRFLSLPEKTLNIRISKIGYFSPSREKKSERARDARVLVLVLVVFDDDWTTTRSATRSASSICSRGASVVQPWNDWRQPRGRTTDYASSHQCHSSLERFLDNSSIQ